MGKLIPRLILNFQSRPYISHRIDPSTPDIHLKGYSRHKKTTPYTLFNMYKENIV